MRKYEVISGDGHLEVPPEYWVKYTPAKYRDRGPRTVKLDDGNEEVVMGEHKMNMTSSLACDLDYDQYGEGSQTQTYHYPDGSSRPGTGDAAQRLREQDTDGIDAELLNPPANVQRFLKNLLPTERDTYLAFVQAYNTWLAEEYCAVAPDRLIGNAIVPESGLEDAIMEGQRCKKMGLRSVNISNWPNGTGWYVPGDENFFAAMVDLQLAVSPHTNFGASGPKTDSPDFTRLRRLTEREGGPAAFAISQLMYYVFDKVPKSVVYIGESYASWIPFNMNRQNEYYIRYQHKEKFHLKKLPSEYYRDNLRLCFIHERSAMLLRYLIGLDIILWGSDFPHTSNTYPHSRNSLDEMFSDVPDEERRRVLVLNPCELFGLDPEKDLTPTPTSH